MSEGILSAREERRYQKQLSLDGIGREGQEKLKKSKILVIGAGGKGTSALQNLITAGIGNVGITDDTPVQETTLSRQSLYGDNDIGKQKAIITKEYLQSRNQFTNITVHNIRLNVENIKKIIVNYDVLIDATNNFETHFNIAEAAHELNKPLVFGTIVNNKSIITVLNVNSSKKLVDIFPEKQAIDIGTGDNRTPIVIINTLTGVALANEAIKIIFGSSSQLIDKLLIINASDYSLSIQPV